MNRRLSISGIILAALLLLFLTLPISWTDPLRGAVASLLSPFWRAASSFKELFVLDAHVRELEEELREKELANCLLRGEITKWEEIAREESLLYLSILELAPRTSLSPLLTKALSRFKEAEKVLSLHLDSLVAKVIFRSQTSWSNTFWIDLGSEENESLQRVIVAKNSPVVLGTLLIGVIDYVGKHQSRVKLLTDPELNPSVRAVRGLDPEKLVQKSPVLYLAKGELNGAIKPSYREAGKLLKGTGFNYDFADEEGAARDLRDQDIPIIKAKDILLTTGMDGVFPKGLIVGEVKKILPLKEGDYYYDVEVQPLINFDDLSYVFVIPPAGFDPLDMPDAG